MLSDESFITEQWRKYWEKKKKGLVYKPHLGAGPGPDNLSSIPAPDQLTVLSKSYNHFNYQLLAILFTLSEKSLDQGLFYKVFLPCLWNRIPILLEGSLHYSKAIITRTSCETVCVVFYRWKLKQCSYQLWLHTRAINLSFQILRKKILNFKYFPVDFL